jgi:threonine dehydratase
MPRNTPFLKVANTEALGATVELHGSDLEHASAFARQQAATRGLVFVHPYDDPDVIAGQGTVALEMLEAEPALDTLLIPVGGGGLIAGCAVAAKGLRPDIEVVGVQSALCPAMLAEIRGETPPAAGLTLAEGIAVKRPGALTRAIVEREVDDIVTVEEGEIEHAIMLLAEIEKLVAEGAGAAALAAVIAHRERFAGRRLGIIVSGGNIDARLLSSVLMRGLIRSGRLVRIRVELSDEPGTLAALAAKIGELGANIVEVVHQRWFHDIPARLTDVDLTLEVRAPDDASRITAALEADGYGLRLLALTASAGIG